MLPTWMFLAVTFRVLGYTSSLPGAHAWSDQGSLNLSADRANHGARYLLSLFMARTRQSTGRLHTTAATSAWNHGWQTLADAGGTGPD